MRWHRVLFHPCVICFQSNDHEQIGLQTTMTDYRAVSVLLSWLRFLMGFDGETLSHLLQYFCDQQNVWLCVPILVHAFVIVVLFVHGVCLCSGLLLWDVATPQTNMLACILHNFLCSYKHKGKRKNFQFWLPFLVAPIWTWRKYRHTHMTVLVYGNPQPYFVELWFA